MVIVSDTSPISNLFLINKLGLLHKFYGRIIIPNAVMTELLVLKEQGIDLSEIENAHWIEVAIVSNTEAVRRYLAEVDLGEAEAIALAKELHATRLLMDEERGRDLAVREGLHIIGIIGILIQAKHSREISSVKQLMDELIQKARFFIDVNLYNHALELANEK